MNRLTRLVGVLFVLVLACDGHVEDHLARAGHASGLVSDERRVLDALVLCDASQYSTCDAETLRAALDSVVLPAVADRPGSRVRLYTLGEEVTARLLATQETTAAAKLTLKAITKHELAWRHDALAFFTTAAAPLFQGTPAQRSKIAEALTRLASEDQLPNADRILLYIGDLRETGIAKLECGLIPDPLEWRQRLDRARLLQPDTLTGVRVLFTNTSITTPGNVQCDTPARAQAIKELWRSAITRAGGTPEFFTNLPPSLERSHS